MDRSVEVPYVQYGQEEAAELETAALCIQHVFDKTQLLVDRFMPDFIWTSLTGIERSKDPGPRDEDGEGGCFQKWIRGPKGWKCVGCETQSPGEGNTSSGTEEVRYPFRVLQTIIWSQYEKILLLHPFLGGEPFFTADELDAVSRYLLPTYLSPSPLEERGKPFKVKHFRSGLPIYQETVVAPYLELESEGSRLQGRWMTGVRMTPGGFGGLRPYLKAPKGARNFVRALIV